MAEEIDSQAAKKRRIIHWNPDAGQEQVSRKWTWKKIVGWTAGGFVGLLLVAAVLIRVGKAVFGPEFLSTKPAQVAAAPTVASASSAFISQAKPNRPTSSPRKPSANCGRFRRTIRCSCSR